MCYAKVMNASIFQELQELSAAEKQLLGEALIMSANSDIAATPVTQAQYAELRARLAEHRANPQEAGVSFEQLKTTILRRHT